MREQTSWSVSVGAWGGIQVRIHVLLVLAAAAALYLCRPIAGADQSSIGLGALSIVVLVLSVLIHELAHVQAALRMEGKADQIILGPFGGLAPVEIHGDPRGELVAIAAGPATNLAVAAVAGTVLAGLGINPFALLHPLEPAGLATGGWLAETLKLTFWINWMLVLLNLLPAAPFDGGRALRAAVLLLWPESGSENASVIVALLGRAAAIVLAIIACAVYAVNQSQPAPPWFALTLLSILLFFSARQEDESAATRRREWALRNYELPDAEEDRDRPIFREDEEELDVIARWREQRQEAKVRRQTELEAEEERRVDDILARLHREGLESLSADDRALLDRVSARYRSKQRSKSQ